MIDPVFIENLPDDPEEAGLALARLYKDFLEDISHEYDGAPSRYGEFIEFLGCFKALQNAHKELEGFHLPDLGRDPFQNQHAITDFFTQLHFTLEGEVTLKKSQQLLEASTTRFSSIRSNGFTYQFDSTDLARIQQLLNELRDQLTQSNLFEEDHKNRLLKRLEKLQQELHKRMSNVDAFWGLLGEAGVAFGKFGEDAKPMFDRVKEIFEIVWRTQAKAEELPSPERFPKLPGN